MGGKKVRGVRDRWLNDGVRCVTGLLGKRRKKRGNSGGENNRFGEKRGRNLQISNTKNLPAPLVGKS